MGGLLGGGERELMRRRSVETCRKHGVPINSLCRQLEVRCSLDGPLLVTRS